jgi:tetratricopeptide (TPR) repeat protein
MRLSASVDLMQHLLDEAEELYLAGRSEEAKLALDSMFQVGDERGLNNEFFIFVLAYNYDVDEEILYAIVDKWIELFPESPEPWQWLASAHAASGRKERAIECYEKVLELNPEDPNAGRRIERLRRD